MTNESGIATALKTIFPSTGVGIAGKNPFTGGRPETTSTDHPAQKKPEKREGKARIAVVVGQEKKPFLVRHSPGGGGKKNVMGAEPFAVFERPKSEPH